MTRSKKPLGVGLPVAAPYSDAVRRAVGDRRRLLRFDVMLLERGDKAAVGTVGTPCWRAQLAGAVGRGSLSTSGSRYLRAK